MKKILMGVLGMSLAVGVALADEPTRANPNETIITVQGTLIDASRYFLNESIGADQDHQKSDAQSDLNSGDPAGVLVGNKVYILLFPSKAFAHYVTQTVEIKGDFYGDNFIYPEKALLVEKNSKKMIKLKDDSWKTNVY